MVNYTEMARTIASGVLQIGDGSVSRHIDEILEDYEEISISGVLLLPLFSEILSSLRQSGEIRTVIWVFGLSETDSINIEQEIALDKIGLDPARSAIYLFEGSDFLVDAFQEYRKILNYPKRCSISGALYRSWRSEVAESNGWEFSNDVYIWSVP